jgi:hypothetical protein
MGSLSTVVIGYNGEALTAQCGRKKTASGAAGHQASGGSGHV